MLADPSEIAYGGRLTEWRSSTDSIFVIEVVLPDVEIGEDDAPILIPAGMRKYLRYFTLGRAFARAGEGRQPMLADHYARRFARGVEFFRALSQLAARDRQFQREPADPAQRRVPLVRLPSEYERVW